MTVRLGKIAVGLLMLLAALPALSQNNLRLLSGKGVFRVYLADRLQNNSPQAEILLENIKEDTLYLKIEFEGQTRQGVTFYLLEKGIPTKGKEFCYRVEPEKGKVTAKFTGLYEIQPLPLPIVPLRPVKDTSAKYLNSRLGRLCELKDGKPLYFKNIPAGGKCTEPMPETYLNYIGLLMSKAQVPDEKFAVAENVCRNNCVDVKQLGALLNYIDYELDKLKLIRMAYAHLTDKQNRANLEKNFRFESSVTELNRLYRERDQAPNAAGVACTAASGEKETGLFLSRLGACTNDSQRLAELTKSYLSLCFTVSAAKSALALFIHDREKLDGAKLLYAQCVEKDRFMEVADVFSYNQSVAELKEYIEKQK
jgi:hypothetical protein